MDPTRFDDLTRHVGRPLGRRLLLAAAAGLLAAARTPRPTAAACNSGNCPNGPCCNFADGSFNQCCPAPFVCCRESCAHPDFVCDPPCADGLQKCGTTCVLPCGPGLMLDFATCACVCAGEQCGDACCPLGKTCSFDGGDDGLPVCCDRGDACGAGCRSDPNALCCPNRGSNFMCVKGVHACCPSGSKGGPSCCLKSRETCDRGRCVRKKKKKKGGR